MEKPEFMKTEKDYLRSINRKLGWGLFWFYVILIVTIVGTCSQMVAQNQKFQLDSLPDRFGEEITWIIPGEYVPGYQPGPFYLEVVAMDGTLLTRITTQGATVSQSLSDPFTIIATPRDEEISQVKWYIDNQLVQTENLAPYTMTGDIGGDFNPWTPKPGTYKIDAINQKGQKFSITVNVEP